MKIDFINEGAFGNYKNLTPEDIKKNVMKQSAEEAKAKLIDIASKKIVELCSSYYTEHPWWGIINNNQLCLVSGILATCKDSERAKYGNFIPTYEYINNVLKITLYLAGSSQVVHFTSVDNDLFNLIDEIESEIPNCEIHLKFIDSWTHRETRFMNKNMYINVGSDLDINKFVKFLNRFDYTKLRPSSAPEISFNTKYLKKMNYGSSRYDDCWWSNCWSNLCPNLGQIVQTLQNN